MIEFKQERAQDCFEEAMPLLIEHWKEIAHYKDIPLAPDFDLYRKLEDLGMVRCYTARDENNSLVGYAVYFIKANPHYKFSKQASQDILFVSKDRRGMGGRFIKWCDEQLQLEKVQIVHHHVKCAHDFGPMLERFGYEKIESIYSRRLDL